MINVGRFLTLVCCCAALAVAAGAQVLKVPGGGALRKADSDGNGQLTAAEFQAAFPKHDPQIFNRLDKNDDGVLDGKDRVGQNLPDMYRRADVDKDGRVSYEELQKAAPDLTPERFARLDKNGDGFLSAADRQEESKADKKSAPKNDAQANALWYMYQKADSDGDGKTTYDEIATAKPGFPQENFKSHDTNDDGVISLADRG